jgi:hypothetical protein
MTHETHPEVVNELLSDLSATFPAHHITAEYTADDSVRYTARSRRDDAHPRLVVTRDPAELYAVLGTPAVG